MTGICHIVFEISEVETELFCCYRVVTGVDLHHTHIATVYLAPKDGTVLIGMAERGFATSDLSHNRNVHEVFANRLLDFICVVKNHLRYYLLLGNCLYSAVGLLGDRYGRESRDCY